ncbi:MAG: starch-binding protein [Prevotella sp.]|nr:starch-binding protein [Prevotella sp.]
MEKRYFGKLLTLIFVFTFQLSVSNSYAADGWPSQYKGVMLQAFYWDSFDATNWTVLEKQAKELGEYFSLVWLPQSANCGGTSMGYDDLYWFTNYSSSFGTEQELRSLIKAFKANGIGTIADVVINHRKSNNGWFGFPSETYKGVTYSMSSTDVCSDDDNGKAKTEANRLGVQLGNADTGEGWDGMRDLDHKSNNVQNCVKAYLDLLLNDLGYAGFRYDMVKGYAGSYTKLYNESANPTYSVGECWDGTNTIRNWIDATGKTSAAFDFQFRYTVRNAANRGDWSNLGKQNDGSWPLISNNTQSGAYRRYAVTFVENHDTERRSNASQDPLTKDTLAANAYMLAMPGTPCVFLTHWLDCKQDIKAMIDVRNLVGIHNESTTANMATSKNYYVVRTTGTDGQLLCVLGPESSTYTPNGQWVRVINGYHYAYYLQPSMNIAWVDCASGHYEKSFPVTLTAVSDNSSAQLVYTLDGTTPSASNGTRCASGTQVTIPAEKTTTLKVGLLIGSAVSTIQTRVYEVSETKPEEVTVPDFCTRTDDEVCAFFEAPQTWTSTICCWAWTDSPSDNFTYSQRKNWPGVDCTFLGTADNGKKVWKWTWDGTKQNNSSAKQPAMIIFSNNGSPQTADLVFTNGGYYNEKGLQAQVTTGIETILGSKSTVHSSDAIYDLSGRKVGSIGTSASRLPKGIYIVGGRKFVIK